VLYSSYTKFYKILTMDYGNCEEKKILGWGSIGQIAALAIASADFIPVLLQTPIQRFSVLILHWRIFCLFDFTWETVRSEEIFMISYTGSCVIKTIADHSVALVDFFFIRYRYRTICMKNKCHCWRSGTGITMLDQQTVTVDNFAGLFFL
jgi:hypothetical protein